MAVIEVESYANEVQRFYFEDLKWCGCGNPEEALTFLRDVLECLWARSERIREVAFREIDNDPEYIAAAAKEKELLPLDSPLALSYRYLLSSLELTEHGGSVYGSWLTGKGNAVLAMLTSRDIGEAMDDEDYPEVKRDSDTRPKDGDAEQGSTRE